MTSIGVVIVSFNTRELLRGCLDSLRGCALPLRVVVVENASRDESAAMVRACFPEVELIALERKSGSRRGQILASPSLERSQSESRQGDNETSDARTRSQSPNSPTPNSISILDYVLLLNPDTIVHPGAIEALAAFLEAHPRVGAVGPRLLNPDGSCSRRRSASRRWR